MDILNLIQKWREGCKLAKTKPIDCAACTERLIDNIEMREKISQFSGCITPKFYMVIDRVRESVTFATQAGSEFVSVKVSDLTALLHEFFRIDRELRRLKPYIHVNPSSARDFD